jgi:hypothetical protein
MSAPGNRSPVTATKKQLDAIRGALAWCSYGAPTEQAEMAEEIIDAVPSINGSMVNSGT